jgi:C4-dicarboxylate-specific signal transduction histidine kinase
MNSPEKPSTEPAPLLPLPAAVADTLLVVDVEHTVRSIANWPAGAPGKPGDFIGGPVASFPWGGYAAADRLPAALREAVAERRATFVPESDFAAANGERRRWKVDVVPSADAAGEPVALIRIADATERAFLWTALAATERLAGVGRLAGAAAHEFNNLLGGILGYAELAQTTEKSDDYRRLAAAAFETGDRGRLIAGCLQALAARVPGSSETIALSDALRDPLTLVERRFRKKNIGLSADIDAQTLIETDIAKLQQAVTAALLCEMDRLPPDRNVTVWAGRQDDGSLLVRIADDGEILMPAEIAWLLEPFAAAESLEWGGDPCRAPTAVAAAGLLLQTMGGRLELRPGPEGGAVFNLMLPPQTIVL